MKKKFSSRIFPYLFITPTFILLALFSYYAIFLAFKNSFTDAQFGTAATFIGLENYIALLSDEVFLSSLLNQAILSLVFVFNNIFFPFLAAELLFFVKRKKMANIVKTAFVVPMLVPRIVTILIWKFMYNPSYGINSVLDLFGLSNLTQNWLNDPATALASVIFVGFPFVSGLYFLIFHAGLNSLGGELHEAAIVDGASDWKIAVKIHIPNMTGYIGVVALLSFLQSISDFGLVAATTNGGPGFASMIPSLQMYKVAFGSGEIGYASSMGVVIFIIMIVITLTARRITRKGGKK